MPPIGCLASEEGCWAIETFRFRFGHRHVFAFNIASTKVLQKAGFELEGRLRNECFPNGSPVDLLVFGKLSS